MLFGLGLAIVTIGSVLTLVSPNAGLLLYWAWFIVRPQEVVEGLGGPLPMERILALALITSLVIHYRLLQAKPFFFGRITWALAGFLAVNYLSILTAVWRGGALYTANELGKIFILYFCLINLTTNAKELRRFLWVYMLGIAWESGSSLWAYGAHPYYAQGIQRATSLEATWGDPNTTAANLLLTIPVLLALLKGTRSFLGRTILLGFLALYVVCIVLTGSRTGLVVTGLVFVVMALQSSKRLLLVPALVVFSILGWIFMPAEYQRRYETLSKIAQDVNSADPGSAEAESAHGRIIGFVVGMQMFVHRPILGVGAGQFPTAWRSPDTPYSYHGQKSWHQPHNLPGQLLSELGLLGAFSFGYYVITLLRQNRAVRRELEALRSPPGWLIVLSKAMVAVVIALFVWGFGGHNLYRYNWYLAGGLVGLLQRITEQEKSPEQSPSEVPLPAAARWQPDGG